MEEATFLIRGSAAEPYRVRFRWGEGSFVATCTCAAAHQGSHCKHRLGVLLGDRSMIAGQDGAQIAAVVAAAATTTDLQERLADLSAAEARVAAAKDEVAAARRRLSEALLGL